MSRGCHGQGKIRKCPSISAMQWVARVTSEKWEGVVKRGEGTFQGVGK